MQLYFITGNKSKFGEVQSMLGNIEQFDIDLPEIQDIDAKNIIRAKLLKCSERQIFRYLKQGKLGGSKQGKWRFTDEDVRAFLDAGRRHKSNK